MTNLEPISGLGNLAYPISVRDGHPRFEDKINVPAYTVGKHCLQPFTDFDNDERGIIWLFEPPRPSATYVVAVDPTVGRTGWTRETRVADDYKTDNGAVEVIRAGVNGKPDVQVAEFAAPLDAFELAAYAATLGRLYHGKDEEALCIIEMYPGPGLITFREMIDKFGYFSHFVQKYLDAPQATPPNRFGFWANSRDAVKYLWINASKYIQSGNFEPRSPWLVEEMRNCEIDPVKMYGKASFGTHDDRVRAIMMGLWAIHDWSMQVNTSTDPLKKVTQGKEPNWQASDMSYEGMMQAWEEKFAELVEA